MLVSLAAWNDLDDMDNNFITELGFTLRGSGSGSGFDSHMGPPSMMVVGAEDLLCLEDTLLDVLELGLDLMLLLSSWEEGFNEERGAGITWSKESLRETF
jgi:hypothetical protein